MSALTVSARAPSVNGAIRRVQCDYLSWHAATAPCVACGEPCHTRRLNVPPSFGPAGPQPVCVPCQRAALDVAPEAASRQIVVVMDRSAFLV